MSKAPYDEHYREPRIFGEPLRGLISFFAELRESSRKLEVWDLGAGQGRDTLALASIGHCVKAVDISALGLEQLAKEAAEKFPGLVETHQGDIHSIAIESCCDALLLDSMFHFYARDKEKETNFLKRISHELKYGGYLALAIVANAKTKEVLDKLLGELWINWTIRVDETERHTDTKADYRILILEKPGE